MMSKDKVTSPTRFNGELDHFFDPNFTEEISHRMQVPKRIKVNGDCEDDGVMGVGSHPPPPVWENEKFDMHVPDRILVVDSPEPVYSATRKHSVISSSGLSRIVSTDTIISVNSAWRNPPHTLGSRMSRIDRPRTSMPVHSRSRSNHRRKVDHTRSEMDSPDSIERFQYDDSQNQLLGTRGAPIETNLENAVLPSDPGLVRVQTPPRIITLTDHYFPSADDLPTQTLDDPLPMNTVVRPQRTSQALIDAEGDRRNDIRPVRESTPSLAEGMSTNEEIAHLRRQLAKLNRRVMSIELENLQRQQCEKIVFIMGITYAIWKTLIWLRNS